MRSTLAVMTVLALLAAVALPATAAESGAKATETPAAKHEAEGKRAPGLEPREYVWRELAACNDLIFQNVRTRPLVGAGRQRVRGSLEHRGRHTVRDVEVCGDGACTSIRAGREMHNGDVAQFDFSIPTTAVTPITVRCSVRMPAGPS